MQTQNGPPTGVMAVFFSFWCFGIVLMLAQFTMALIALVQILQRRAPTDQKILWGAVSWFIPIVGPILWWTIGSKQVGVPARPPEYPHERRD